MTQHVRKFVDIMAYSMANKDIQPIRAQFEIWLYGCQRHSMLDSSKEEWLTLTGLEAELTRLDLLRPFQC